MAATKIEEYVETVYEVVQEKGYAKVIDVSRLLDVGPSTVSEMFRKLDNKGYIRYKKYSGVTLTEKGTDLAVELSVKHKVLKEFLSIIGLKEEFADEDACKIEHVVRPETMDILTKFVNFIQVQENPRWLERFKKYYRTGELP